MKKPPTLTRLATESRNPRSMRLDSLSTRGVLELINREDQGIARAIFKAIPQISRAVELIVRQLRHGGRLIYVGAGTSGRIGILDAVECVPTFNTSPQMVQGLIAGGYEACYRAVEASEDDAEAGAHDLRRRKITRRDVIVGIAASGRTPYTYGALRFARSMGAKTVAVVNNPQTKMKQIAHVTIEAVTGPEVLTGSTRMKAGTAQKLICNMLSTAALVRLGAVYSNLMIHVHMKNEKLVARGITILREIAGVDETKARDALAAANNDLRVATVMLQGDVAAGVARKLLLQQQGNLQKALQKVGRRKNLHKRSSVVRRKN
jgi:N-acetylmuramic acid 6-phosphate etherase